MASLREQLPSNGPTVAAPGTFVLEDWVEDTPRPDWVRADEKTGHTADEVWGLMRRSRAYVNWLAAHRAWSTGAASIDAAHHNEGENCD